MSILFSSIGVPRLIWKFVFIEPFVSLSPDFLLGNGKSLAHSRYLILFVYARSFRWERVETAIHRAVRERRDWLRLCCNTIKLLLVKRMIDVCYTCYISHEVGLFLEWRVIWRSWIVGSLLHNCQWTSVLCLDPSCPNCSLCTNHFEVIR